jgi:hypothetical protein
MGSLSSDPPHPKRHSGTASKQVPRRPNLMCLLSEEITGMFESSEDHLNELGFELVAFRNNGSIGRVRIHGSNRP